MTGTVAAQQFVWESRVPETMPLISATQYGVEANGKRKRRDVRNGFLAFFSGSESKARNSLIKFRSIGMGVKRT